MAGGVRKTNLRVNVGIGGVDMPSMRAAVSESIGFEMETDADTAEKEKKEAEAKKSDVIFKYKDKKSTEELEMHGR